MKYTIQKGVARGLVKAPTSKSMAHRLLICAAMCDGVSTVRDVSLCEDVLATMDCLRALGAECEVQGTDVTVRGLSPTRMHPHAPLHCRESGSTLRFLLPVAMMSGKSAVFYGDGSLMSRPMNVYEALFGEKNKQFLSDGSSIVVRGPLDGGEYTVAGNVSSQFISGLLFALPSAPESSVIRITPPIESRPYIDLTIEALRMFGVEVDWQDDCTLLVRGAQDFRPADVTVEGDYSGAAFLEAFNLFGGNVRIEGLREPSLQGDRVYKTYFDMLRRGVPTIHIGDCPDLGPVLFAAAAAKNGGVFTGTRRLRIKESDRARAMADELTRFGTSVTVYEDTVVIYPVEFHAPELPLDGHADHRIVMALATLLSLTGGEIEGVEAVSKSYPSFFEDIRSLGIEVTE